MSQNLSLRFTKEQLEYDRIDKEYEYVKKRALTNTKLNAEASFHNRALAMLN
jgi:hypothetical protein